MEEGVEGGPPRAAMAMAPGARRGELGSGREGGWRWFGKVEEGTRILTSKGIEPR